MNDNSFDALLNDCAPPVIARDDELLVTLDGLIAATAQPAPARRAWGRSAVAGLVVVGTLGIGGVAAAGGWLPYSWSPWTDQAFDSGQECQLRFMATEQTEPALAEGVSGIDQREAVIAAQAFLDGFDPATIDQQAALDALLAEQARVNVNVPEWDRAPQTQEELEVHALIFETGKLLRAALERQGLNPYAADITTTTECESQR